MRRTLPIAIAGVLALTVAGCSSVPDQLDGALTSSISATASARLHTRLDLTGRELPSVVATGYADAVSELTDAERTAVDAAPRSGEVAARRRTLAGIRSALDAVLAAQNALGSGRSLRPAERAIANAVDRLHSIDRRTAP